MDNQSLMTEKEEEEILQEAPAAYQKPVSRMADIFGSFDLHRQPTQPQRTVGYLEGLKGLMALEAFLWVFMRTIVPGAVFESLKYFDGRAPRFQSVLRELLSPLFWDGSLQAAFFIMISARIVCIRFVREGTPVSMAGSLFRRGIRLWIPVAVALAIATAVSHAGGFDLIPINALITGNKIPEVPYQLPNAWAYLNSVFNIFWSTDKLQAGNKAFPTGQLWIVSVIFQESYTVYMTMLLLPYLTKSWRLWALSVFGVISWWVHSWAWYGITGLMFTDAVVNMDFVESTKQGIRIPKTKKRFSVAWVAGLCFAIGIIQKYVWADAAPSKINDEYIVHTSPYGSGGFNQNYSLNEPIPRVDNFFTVIGVLLFIELSPVLQRIFANPVFRYLGRISFSWFLIQSTFIYSAGLNINSKLVNTINMAEGVSAWITFVACLFVTILGADIFTRLVDNPSKKLADFLFVWIRE